MFAYRSIVLGLLGACCVLLAMRPPLVVAVSSAELVVAAPRCPPSLRDLGPTIVDVAPGVTPSQIAGLLRLAPGERITSVDDVPVTSSIDAGFALATLDLRSRRFIDLDITGEAGERRVLVLLH